MPLSSEVEKILDRLIEREGGYVNHPADPGGETKYGISKRSYLDVDIPALTKERARDIYERDFYHRFSLSGLRDLRAIEWILDWLVHSGPSVIRRIQRELKIEADGVVGEATITAINNMADPKDLLRWRLVFLCGLTKHPFIKGWVNRLVKLGL